MNKKTVKGFLYLLSHPSDTNLFKIGVTRRHPSIRLQEHNTQFGEACGVLVKETGVEWVLEKFIQVDDVFNAEHAFWKRPPLTEIPYAYSNELLKLSPDTELNHGWIADGFEAAEKIGVRADLSIPPIPKTKPKRGAEWIKKQLENTGIRPIKGYGNGVTNEWFVCKHSHKFKISGYVLVGGYKLLRKPSCPVCNPENFNYYELRKIETN